jgi:hypothetical protein
MGHYFDSEIDITNRSKYSFFDIHTLYGQKIGGGK